MFSSCSQTDAIKAFAPKKKTVNSNISIADALIIAINNKKIDLINTLLAKHSEFGFAQFDQQTYLKAFATAFQNKSWNIVYKILNHMNNNKENMGNQGLITLIPNQWLEAKNPLNEAQTIKEMLYVEIMAAFEKDDSDTINRFVPSADKPILQAEYSQKIKESSKPTILLVCGYYCQNNSACKATLTTRDTSKNIKQLRFSEQTNRTDYFADMLAQQRNLRNLINKLSDFTVCCVFMYDLVRDTVLIPKDIKIDSVILSGGNFSHDKIKDVDTVFNQLPDVPMYGICLGFQLLARKFLNGEIKEMLDEVNADVSPSDVGVHNPEYKGTKLCFHHKNYIHVDDTIECDNKIMSEGKLMAFSKDKYTGVQWHPEVYDNTWELFMKRTI